MLIGHAASLSQVGPRSGSHEPGGAAPAAADAAAAERADAEDAARRVSAVCRMAVWRAWRGDPSGLDPIYSASLHEDACALLAECGASPDPSPRPGTNRTPVQTGYPHPVGPAPNQTAREHRRTCARARAQHA